MKRFLAVLLFLGGMKAWAQDVPNLYFTTPLNIESGRDAGIPVGDQKIDATSVVMSLPMFTIMKPSPRGDFMMGYSPEFAFYNAHTDLNSWNHQFLARWQHRFTSRLDLALDESFYSTRDNARRFDSTFLLPFGRYNEQYLTVRLSYLLRPTTVVKFRWDNSWVDFNSEHLATPLLFNVLSNTEGLSVEQKLSAKSKLTGTYSYVRSHSFNKFDGAGFPVGPIPATNYAGGTYDYQLAPTLLLEGNAGYIRTASNSYALGGLAEKHFARFILSGGYSRYLTLLGATQPSNAAFATPSSTAPGQPGNTVASQVNVLTGPFGAFGPNGRFGNSLAIPTNSITQTASLHAIGPLTRHLSVTLSVLASRTGANAGGGNPLESLVTGLRFDYKLSDHFGIFTDTQFFAQTNTPALPVGISRRRWFGGVQYTFSPTPEEIARHIDQIHSNDTTAAPVGDAGSTKPEDK